MEGRGRGDWGDTTVGTARDGGLGGDPEQVHTAGRGTPDAGSRRRGATGRGVRASGVVGEGTGREEGGAFVAVQGPVLTSEEFTAAVLADGGGAEGAIGLVSRHFGKQAFETTKN